MTYRTNKLKTCILSLCIMCLMAMTTILFTGCTFAASNSTVDHLEITALDVGEADCFLIQEGETVIMIDTGLKKSSEYILQTLKDKKIVKIDYLIITHYDKDHVGGAAELLSKVKVEQILCPDYTGTRDEFIAFRQAAPNRMVLSEKAEYTCGNLNCSVQPASNPNPLIAEQADYDNDLSLVVTLEYGSRKFLFTGDIEKRRIEQMLNGEELNTCDWIKIPHHGKYQKKLVELLDTVNLQYAVISTSSKQAAEEKLITLLKDRSISYESTENGAVTTYCDGDSIWFQKDSTK